MHLSNFPSLHRTFSKTKSNACNLNIQPENPFLNKGVHPMSSYQSKTTKSSSLPSSVVMATLAFLAIVASPSPSDSFLFFAGGAGAGSSSSSSSMMMRSSSSSPCTVKQTKWIDVHCYTFHFCYKKIREHSQSRMEAKQSDGLFERNGLPFEYWDQTVWPIIFYFELGLPEREIFRQMVLVSLKVIQ